MGAGKLARGGLAGIALRWASRLRFPYLFAITALLFVVNLFVPDAIPMADELVMGLVALVLGSLRKRSKSKNGSDESSNDADTA
ncbi:MAG: DUF6116 family protein [Gammaproteobacteria bacterium]